MTAQERYEIDEATNLELAREFQRQGHTFQCSHSMIRGSECICQMENWRNYDRMER